MQIGVLGEPCLGTCTLQFTTLKGMQQRLKECQWLGHYHLENSIAEHYVMDQPTKAMGQCATVASPYYSISYCNTTIVRMFS
jgi:hypothetical protein